jgi:hypothetical protein
MIWFGQFPVLRRRECRTCVSAEQNDHGLSRPYHQHMGQDGDDFQKGEADGTREALAALGIIITCLDGAPQRGIRNVIVRL